METRDMAAIAAWFLNTLGVALLAGMAAGAVVGVIGAASETDWLVWAAFAVGPAVTGIVLMTSKAPSQRRLSETQAPTT